MPEIVRAQVEAGIDNVLVLEMDEKDFSIVELLASV